MSDCDKCVHTYLSGNCVLGCDQTFTTIENRVVNSSLEPDCPHFVLSGRVRDSNDSVRDSSDSVRDSSDSVRDSSDSVKDSSDQDNILFILIGLNDILFGVTGTSAIFYGLQEIPNLNFITSSFITLLVICLAINLRQRQLTAGGDDK